ncbi:hypothetical protein JCM31598_21370 [Desulfonatronum parangueonense]
MVLINPTSEVSPAKSLPPDNRGDNFNPAVKTAALVKKLRLVNFENLFQVFFNIIHLQVEERPARKV